ncbi:hypothetical protein ACH9D2_16365 [Kocuria sp. M4R2S49]|uniref:hypothetical protein n=1 Tax=Kocuria rhizosphaericola TaxID=3376284 RepID=UPI0037ACA946
MPTSLGINLVALAFLSAGLLFLARGLVEGRGTMPKGRDRRAAAGLFLVSAVLFLAAGSFLLSGD